MKLRVGKLEKIDAWKDIVRVKSQFRKDKNGKHIKRGTICRITVGKSSAWAIVHGRESKDNVIQMDLNMRLALKVSLNDEYDFSLEKLGRLRSLWFPWRASDPIVRLPAQLGFVSLFIGAILGIIGIAVPFVQDYISKYHSK